MSTEADTKTATETTEAPQEPTKPGLLEEAMGSVADEAETHHGDSSPEDFLSGVEKSFDEAINKGRIEPKEGAAPDKGEESAKADGEENPDESEGEAKTPSPEDFPSAEEAGLEGDAKARWGRLRKELYAARDELKALKESEGPKPDAAAQVEIEKLRKDYEAASERLQKYEKELAISRVEATPEFENAVTKPLESIINAAEKLAEANEVDSDRLIAAISETDQKRQSELLTDVVDGMSERDRARVYRMADDTAAILRKEEELRSNADQALQEVETRKQQEAEATRLQHQKAVASAVDKVADMLAARLPHIEGLDMSSLIEEAKSTDFSRSSPDAQGYSIVAGATLPQLVSSLRQQQSRIQQLEQELQSIHKATPTAGGGQTGAPSKADSEKGFLDAVFDHG